MRNEEIIRWMLDRPDEAVDIGWIKDMLKQYPAFFLPAAVVLKRRQIMPRDTQMMLQNAVAVNTPDRAGMADFIDIADTDWMDIYPTHRPAAESSTDLTIDKFLNTYGHRNPSEDALLERLIFNPVPADYLTGTDTPLDPDNPLALPDELKDTSADNPTGDPAPAAAVTAPDTPVGVPTATVDTPAVDDIPGTAPQTTAEPDKTAEHDSVASAPKSTSATPKTDFDSSEEPLLMETLSKFFIKQGRYERAYEIISKLSLNNPEKSVYFADQLRFLQKLIINQQHLSSKK